MARLDICALTDRGPHMPKLAANFVFGDGIRQRIVAARIGDPPQNVIDRYENPIGFLPLP